MTIKEIVLSTLEECNLENDNKKCFELREYMHMKSKGFKFGVQILIHKSFGGEPKEVSYSNEFSDAEELESNIEVVYQMVLVELVKLTLI